MTCSRCQAVLVISPENSYEVRYLEEKVIKRLDCSSCGECVSLNFHDAWVLLDDILITKDAEKIKDGWFMAKSSKEKKIHYVLSQICYREHDLPNEKYYESIFDLPDQTDSIQILWFQGHAIGFYSVKPKGTMIVESMNCYAMNTLDTAYIQSDYRRCGHGLSLIHHLIETYPNQDLGFSKPISTPMLKVLNKFLSENVSARKWLWEVEGSGGEGNRKLIWFLLMRGKRKINAS